MNAISIVSRRCGPALKRWFNWPAGRPEPPFISIAPQRAAQVYTVEITWARRKALQRGGRDIDFAKAQFKLIIGRALLSSFQILSVSSPPPKWHMPVCDWRQRKTFANHYTEIRLSAIADWMWRV